MSAVPAHQPNPHLFYPPHARPLKGDEGFLRATWKFIQNPVEGLGPLSYNQPITSAPIIGSGFRRIRLHVVSDPAGMDTILSTHARNFSKAPIDHRILGPATKEGLLSVHGEQWKRQRKAVAPIFRPRHVEHLAGLITEVVDEYAAGLGAGAELELNSAMAELTFDVLAKALLGDPKGIDGARLKVATRNVVTGAGTLRPDDLIPFPRWVPRPMAPKGARALKELKAAADALIDSRDPDDPGDDLVGLIVGTGLTAREQRDNLIGFFIAGHETTALTLTWALYLLGRAPDMAARVREEVESVAGAGSLGYAHTQHMPVTQAVIDETMRLYPPAPLINRECQVETEVCGRIVEPNDHCLLANYIMHRTERLWEDPHSFDPDRFLRDPSLKAKGAPFKPWGGGPRICVGMAFATVESLIALGTLVRDFDIHIGEEVYPKPVMTVTLRPEGGVPARLVRRRT